MHGLISFDGKKGSHGCVCGTVIEWDLKWLQDHFLTSDPDHPEKQEHHGLALPPCPNCPSQTHLNMIDPDPNHPHPSAAILRKIHAAVRVAPPKAHLNV